MFPEVEISNGVVDVRLYLPDPDRGYYRGTRFDWSGIISRLCFAGHRYFGQWFEHHDPKKHDAVTGPAEEFEVEGGGLGYAEAKAGESFIRIGVGVLRKPDEAGYRKYGTYEIIDPGRWSTRQGKDWIEFAHRVRKVSGFAYLYRKVVRLTENRPELVIHHTLKNVGSRALSTFTYNHNFLFIDGTTSGPAFRVRFPFEVRAEGDLKGLAETSGRDFRYRKELVRGESIYTVLGGYGASAGDHRINIENCETSAGVAISGDRPLAQLIFWSVPRAICPEPYVRLEIGPGEEVSWESRYSFYTLPISTES